MEGERRKPKEREAIEKPMQDYHALAAGVNAISQKGRRTLALVLFTVRERKLRKLGVGCTIEAARADAAKQILRHIGEGEKVSLEQSVMCLRKRGRTSSGDGSRVLSGDIALSTLDAIPEEEGSGHGKQR